MNFDPRVDPFTISLWVRSNTANGYRTLLGKDGNREENWRVQYRLWTTDTPSTVQGVSGGNWSGGLSTILNDGQWHLLTMVNYLDAGTWRTRVYFNDGSEFTQWNTGEGGTVPRLLRIGDTTNGGNGWRGQIDDLRIYRRALSQAEVASLYNPPAAPLNYDSWLASLASPPPAGQLGTHDDPDSDNIVNLMEYALGSDPMVSSTTSLPEVEMREAPDPMIRFTYLRAREDIDYSVISTISLADDSWSPDGVTQDTTSPVGGSATATMPFDPVTSPQRFLRLKVSER